MWPNFVCLVVSLLFRLFGHFKSGGPFYNHPVNFHFWPVWRCASFPWALAKGFCLFPKKNVGPLTTNNFFLFQFLVLYFRPLLVFISNPLNDQEISFKKFAIFLNVNLTISNNLFFCHFRLASLLPIKKNLVWIHMIQSALTLLQIRKPNK